MKIYIVLFAVFIAGVFFYPVFAHADKIGFFLGKNPLPEPVTLLILGAALLFSAYLFKRLLQKRL